MCQPLAAASGAASGRSRPLLQHRFKAAGRRRQQRISYEGTAAARCDAIRGEARHGDALDAPLGWCIPAPVRRRVPVRPRPRRTRIEVRSGGDPRTERPRSEPRSRPASGERMMDTVIA